MLLRVMRELATNPATPDGQLFALARKKEKAADRHWLLRNARRTMKAAGVRVITAHGLRGTSATIGTARTGGAEVMAGALGHTSTAMTERHYIDGGAVADARTEQVAEMLTDLVDPDPE